MQNLKTMTYEVTDRIARITLNRPHRGNGITLDLPRELAECVECADLDPQVHVIGTLGGQLLRYGIIQQLLSIGALLTFGIGIDTPVGHPFNQFLSLFQSQCRRHIIISYGTI